MLVKTRSALRVVHPHGFSCTERATVADWQETNLLTKTPRGEKHPTPVRGQCPTALAAMFNRKDCKESEGHNNYVQVAWHFQQETSGFSLSSATCGSTSRVGVQTLFLKWGWVGVLQIVSVCMPPPRVCLNISSSEKVFTRRDAGSVICEIKPTSTRNLPDTINKTKLNPHIRAGDENDGEAITGWFHMFSEISNRCSAANGLTPSRTISQNKCTKSHTLVSHTLPNTTQQTTRESLP